MRDDAVTTLLVAITKQAVFDYIHAREGTPDFISAKRYLLDDCFGFLDSDLYMEELDRQRKEYWKVRV